jgi:hypothetical protein
MKALYYYLLTALFLVGYGCTEDGQHLPIAPESEAPQPVSNVVVAPLPGAAHITYELPQDRDLLYVRAVSALRSGAVREVKASFYDNELTIDGFSDTNEYTVKLYSVGRNGKESAPVSVRVTPLEPPIYGAFRSIDETVKSTFGGIKFTVRNPSASNLRIYVYTLDEEGEWQVQETFYTSSVENSFSCRGLAPVPQTLRLAVKDRWDNTTDFIEREFTPMAEEKLDKSKFREVELPTDMCTPNFATRRMDKIWDEDYSNDDFVTLLNYGLPQWFTFDLGVTAKISRLVLYNRASGATYIYNAGCPKEFELFGSMAPSPDGEFDASWIPLRDTPCVSFKPSGLPLGEYTADDIQRQKDGEEFETDHFDEVRYLRFKTNSVWGQNYNINIVEVTIYGEVINPNPQ